MPTATVMGTVGRRTSFEVEINGVLVFSKLAQSAFPDFEEVVEKVVDASNNREVKPCEKAGSSDKCCLL